jgi:hypothetical protein
MRCARELGIATIAAAVGGACAAPRNATAEAQGPTLAFPAHFAEGEGDPEDTPSDAGVAPDATAPAVEPKGTQPDPEPLRVARQWEYEIVYDAGKLRIGSVRAMLFPQPVVTARKMGRYAIELWIGKELVDRIRFDFPLLAAEEPRTSPRRPLKEPPSFAEGAHVSQRVLVPASPRATRAVLVDRATGAEQALPWPPDAPLGPATVSDAGS